MSHHLVPICAYSVNNLSPFIDISNFELLLEEYGSLLVRGPDDARHEDMVGRRG